MTGARQQDGSSAEPAPYRCSHCGGTDIVTGSLSGGEGREAFTPDFDRSFLFPSRLETRAVACLTCGKVDTFVVPEFLVMLVERWRKKPKA